LDFIFLRRNAKQVPVQSSRGSSSSSSSLFFFFLLLPPLYPPNPHIIHSATLAVGNAQKSPTFSRLLPRDAASEPHGTRDCWPLKTRLAVIGTLLNLLLVHHPPARGTVLVVCCPALPLPVSPSLPYLPRPRCIASRRGKTQSGHFLPLPSAAYARHKVELSLSPPHFLGTDLFVPANCSTWTWLDLSIPHATKPPGLVATTRPNANTTRQTHRTEARPRSERFVHLHRSTQLELQSSRETHITHPPSGRSRKHPACQETPPNPHTSIIPFSSRHVLSPPPPPLSSPTRPSPTRGPAELMRETCQRLPPPSLIPGCPQSCLGGSPSSRLPQRRERSPPALLDNKTHG
jgi:hypothetical protein